MKNTFLIIINKAGLEKIISLTEYNDIDKQNTMNILMGMPAVRNPASSIIRSVLTYAFLHPEDRYEIYGIDCDKNLDEEYWLEQFNNNFDETKNFVENQGQVVYKE